jgi:hypothetical protein
MPMGRCPTSPEVLFRQARRLPGRCRAWGQERDGLCQLSRGDEASIGSVAVIGRRLDATVEAVALIRRACRKEEYVRRLIL